MTHLTKPTQTLLKELAYVEPTKTPLKYILPNILRYLIEIKVWIYATAQSDSSCAQETGG